MTQRADIINSIAKAKDLAEQGRLVGELDRFDRETNHRLATAGGVEWADMVVKETLAPALAHERSTHETDWLGEITASTEDWSNRVTAEAARWFGRTSPEVRADKEEFAEQAKGMARRTASAYGEVMLDAERTFMDYVSFLHTQAASGLDQVEQLVDSHENPKQTPLPEDVFDTFGPPVHPINEGVVGTESSERAPLLQEIEQGGSGGGAPTHHDTTPQPYTYAEVPPSDPASMTSQSLFQPSLAIGYAGSLTEVLAAMQKQACGCPNGGEGEHLGDCELRSNTSSGGYGRDPYDAYDDDWDGHEGSRKEGASSLDQIQQTVNPHEDPAPTPLPTEVAFPWEIEEQPEHEERSDKKTSGLTPAEARAAHVARLSALPTEALTETDKKEIRAYAASLFKTADEYTQPEQYHGPGSANSPATTPVGTGGSEQAGQSAGQADRNAGQAPTFADDSSSVPPFVQGYSEGYGTGQTQMGGAQPGMLPPGAGGMGSYQTHQGSLQTEAKQVECATCGTSDSHFNMQQRGNGHNVDYQCRNCAPTPTDQSKVRWQGSLRVSASFVSPVEAADPEFAKAYKYASRWTPGTRMVKSGSASFEAGLYAGISDNIQAQGDWVALHRQAAERYKDPSFTKRISMHQAFTKQASQALGAFVNESGYLNPVVASGDNHSACPNHEGQSYSKSTGDCSCGSNHNRWASSNNPGGKKKSSRTAATSTDLDTGRPAAGPSATGQTPINGPGTPPILQGGTDPNRPGGPAPYNGAEPYGTPAVPSGIPTSGTPTAIDTTPGAPVDQAAYERLSPQTHAFRQRVQANLLQTRS